MATHAVVERVLMSNGTSKWMLMTSLMGWQYGNEDVGESADEFETCKM